MEPGSFRVRMARWFVLLGVMLAWPPVCGATPPEQVADVRKLLKDPSPTVRLKAARALAEANDAEAISVLIDLLAEVPAGERQTIEAKLRQLAGEWAPNPQLAGDDAISRGIRRDAWASWWRRTDGPALLAALAQHTLTPDKRRRLQELVPQLGSDDFAVRERASQQLQSFGRLALPTLREVAKARDAETARRAKMLVESIETGPNLRLPLAALRLLAVRKPAGAVEALLAYLPFAEDEVREAEIAKMLRVLARQDGKLDSALRRALADKQPKVRAVAAETLIECGGAEGRAAVSTLLKEDTPPVRLRAALALARAGQREGVALLIDLLPLLSAEEGSEVEDVLYQLADDNAPEMPKDADAEKRRAAWLAWWKVNSERVDLRRLTEQAGTGRTLLCLQESVLEIDARGRTLWRIEHAGNPADAWRLPGQRVLIAETGKQRVTERDHKGRILWEKSLPGARVCNVQRLPNGNTFIAQFGGALCEVDRDGKEVYAIARVPGAVQSAYRLQQGAIVCLTQINDCSILETTGKILRKFAVNTPFNRVGCLDVWPDGRILIASNAAGKVTEYDDKGKLLQEWSVPNVTTATGLPNGHILACSEADNRVVELDRAGKIVWEQKLDKAWRARR